MSCLPIRVRDGICVDPPLCRGTSQGKCSSCTEGFVCVGGTVGKIGEVGERELVLVVSVRSGMRHDTWLTMVLVTHTCAILSLPALEPRVFA